MLKQPEFIQEFRVTRWYAMSSNGAGEVASAIVNIRLWSDRRRVKKVYMYFDHVNGAYVTEGAK